MIPTQLNIMNERNNCATSNFLCKFKVIYSLFWLRSCLQLQKQTTRHYVGLLNLPSVVYIHFRFLSVLSSSTSSFFLYLFHFKFIIALCFISCLPSNRFCIQMYFFRLSFPLLCIRYLSVLTN